MRISGCVSSTLLQIWTSRPFTAVRVRGIETRCRHRFLTGSTSIRHGDVPIRDGGGPVARRVGDGRARGGVRRSKRLFPKARRESVRERERRRRENTSDVRDRWATEHRIHRVYDSRDGRGRRRESGRACGSTLRHARVAFAAPTSSRRSCARRAKTSRKETRSSRTPRLGFSRGTRASSNCWSTRATARSPRAPSSDGRRYFTSSIPRRET